MEQQRNVHYKFVNKPLSPMSIIGTLSNDETMKIKSALKQVAPIVYTHLDLLIEGIAQIPGSGVVFMRPQIGTDNQPYSSVTMAVAIQKGLVLHLDPIRTLRIDSNSTTEDVITILGDIALQVIMPN